MEWKSTISEEDIKKINYQEILDQAKSKVCDRYNSGFNKHQREAKEKVDTIGEFIFRTLSMATSFHLNPESVHEPYSPMMVIEGSRTAIPDDFTEDQLDLMDKFLDNIDDPELKARLADILWIRNRDFEKAKQAIQAYLDTATNLQSEELYYAIDRLERALRLASSLGKGGKDLFNDVIKKIEDFIGEIDFEDTFSIVRLLELLLGFGQGDASKYAKLTEKLAEEAESKEYWRSARSCWETNSKWHSKLGESEEERKALKKAAETHVKEAEAAASKMVAARFLQQAIEAHRRIGGHQQRTQELHSKLLQIQRGIKDEMGSYSHDIDITKLVEYAQSNVEGKDFLDAVYSLCLLLKPINVEALKERTEKLTDKYPLQFIASGALLDEEGKTIAEYPNLLTGTPEEREEALYAHMNRQAHYDIQTMAVGIINPARKQIILEHVVRESTFYDIVRNNPLIPPGREYLFAKGLYEGFKGDFVSATNLLITQFEHSMRYGLNNYGVITSGIDDQRRQDDRSLNTTLDVDELKEIFGEDLAFTLRSLLVNRFGGNLRNKVAHGLMGYNSYFSAESVYFWGIMLRMVCWPGIVNTYGWEKDEEDAMSEDVESVDQEE